MAKNKNDTNQDLKVEVKDGKLIISIGISTLAWAALHKNGGPLPENCEIVNEREFAFDCKYALEVEDKENQSSLIERTLDEAFLSATSY
jgi:hypothetical protein